MKIILDHDICRALTLAVLNGESITSIDDGDKDWLGYKLDSGASKMNVMLIKGATRQEMESARGGIDAQLHSLRTKHGLTIAREGEIYSFDKSAIQSQSPTISRSTTATSQAPKAAVSNNMSTKSGVKGTPGVLIPDTTHENPHSSDAASPTTVNVQSHAERKFKLELTKLIIEILVVLIGLLGGLYAILK